MVTLTTVTSGSVGYSFTHPTLHLKDHEVDKDSKDLVPVKDQSVDLRIEPRLNTRSLIFFFTPRSLKPVIGPDY